MIQRYLDARSMHSQLHNQRQSGVDKEASLREKKTQLSRELSELEGNQYRKAFGRVVDALQLKLQHQQHEMQSEPHRETPTRDTRPLRPLGCRLSRARPLPCRAVCVRRRAPLCVDL